MAKEKRLADDESEALSRKFTEGSCSMQDVARAAISRHTTDEDAQFRTLVAAFVQRD